MSVKFGISASGGGTVDVRMLRRAARSDEVLVGYPAGMELPSGLDAAELASWLNDGTSTIPARPHVLEGIRAGMGEIRQAIKLYLAEKTKKGDRAEALLNRVGATAVGAIQEFTRGDFFKETIPNAPSTLRGKRGGDTPLIDTGAYIDSTTYVVGQPKESREPALQDDELGAET